LTTASLTKPHREILRGYAAIRKFWISALLPQDKVICSRNASATALLGGLRTKKLSYREEQDRTNKRNQHDPCVCLRNHWHVILTILALTILITLTILTLTIPAGISQRGKNQDDRY
jgi:hypothetical protein